ncbi:porin [Cupriavidus basilensis]
MSPIRAACKPRTGASRVPRISAPALKAIFDLNGFSASGHRQAGPLRRRLRCSPAMPYVGLQSATLGTVKMGRNTTPYFLSTILFNPLVDSYVFSPDDLPYVLLAPATASVYDPGIIGDSGWNNSLVYSTPNFGGLTANAIYAFGEQAGSDRQEQVGRQRALLQRQRSAATVAFQQVKFNSVPGDVTASAIAALVRVRASRTPCRCGVSYDFKVVKLFAQGQYIKSERQQRPTGDIKHTNGQVGALGARWATATCWSRTPTTRPGTRCRGFQAQHGWTVAYDYNLSKRTDVYAAYFYDKITSLSARRHLRCRRASQVSDACLDLSTGIEDPPWRRVFWCAGYRSNRAARNKNRTGCKFRLSLTQVEARAWVHAVRRGAIHRCQETGRKGLAAKAAPAVTGSG